MSPIEQYSAASREQNSVIEISSDRCFSKIGKGQDAKDLPLHMLVMDTGQPWMPPEERRHPKTPEEVDELYRETIRQGMIDHHSFDAAVRELPEGATRRCATKMVADFPEDVLEQMQKRSVTEIVTHVDSDLDAISSTYLAKALLQSGDASKMPSITKELGDIVNVVDYGRYQEKDPNRYAHSISGLFGGLKHILSDKQRVEMGKVWSDQALDLSTKRQQAGEIASRYSEKLIELTFEVLNACNKQKMESGTIDLNFIELEGLTVSDRAKQLLERGVEITVQQYREFDEALERAEQHVATITTKEGVQKDVPLVVFSEISTMSPLTVTTLGYLRFPPEAIIAAFAGPDRKHGGDHYDIGIKAESSEFFTLDALLMPMNKAEQAERERLFPNLSALAAGQEQPNEEQAALLERWKMTPEALQKKWSELRKGFEQTGIGDPTVVVAGGSLVAASTTALLTKERFVETLKEALQAKPVKKSE